MKQKTSTLFALYIAFLLPFKAIFSRNGEKFPENGAAGEIFLNFTQKFLNLVRKKAAKFRQNRKKIQNSIISSA